MSEWITDRLPTAEDAFMDSVFVMAEPLVGRPEEYVIMRNYQRVLLGDAWQPIQVPAPYVKPKRWTVEWMIAAKRYSLWFDGHYCHTMPKSCNYKAAREIEHIYNEVMP
jgi:hypothetical protein